MRAGTGFVLLEIKGEQSIYDMRSVRCFDVANQIGVEIGGQIHGYLLLGSRSEQLSECAYDDFHGEVVLGGYGHRQQKALNVYHLVDYVIDHWLGQAREDRVSAIA